MILKVINTAFLLFLLLSCSQSPRDAVIHNKKKTDELINVNKYLLNKDSEIIDKYVKRRNWEMSITQTGLRYMIIEHGKGPKVNLGDKVTVKYTLALLDGTVCYSSDKDSVKCFVVGKGGVESGLEEGVQLMHLGDKARFILLPHLAYGLIGDEKCIPARSIIQYETELTQIDN